VTLEPPVVVPEPAGAIRCPRCQRPVAPDQDWCLECGAAARTRLAPTPNWRLPIIVLALVAVLAGAGLAVAFVALTDDNSKAPTTATSETAPAVATEPTAAPTPTTPPTSATTPATTTAPPITTTTPGASIPTTTAPPATVTTPPPSTTK
jgi:hypothetical protein